TNKLDDEELACLFKYLTKDTTNLANIEKCLVSCLNNNTSLLYLRELSKESSSGAGDNVFINNHDPSAQGSSEVDVTQPFCKNVVSEINEILNGMRLSNLLVLGDGGGQVRDNFFPDIIIGRSDFYRELTENPPDLLKGLGWEVKNDLSNSSKVTEGKGQLIKYARAYLTANPSLTNVFYRCLMDGKLWLFVKIQFVLDNPNNPI
ncbi:19073_t:CDS:2, partial [Funneliformis geosporum]